MDPNINDVSIELEMPDEIRRDSVESNKIC